MLESAGGEALHQVNEQRSMEKTMDPELHSRTSEYREHSQKSRRSEKVIDKKTSRKIVDRMWDKGVHPGDSDFLEHSQNSLPNGEPKVDTLEVNVSFTASDGQCSVATSEF